MFEKEEIDKQETRCIETFAVIEAQLVKKKLQKGSFCPSRWIFLIFLRKNGFRIASERFRA